MKTLRVSALPGSPPGSPAPGPGVSAGSVARLTPDKGPLPCGPQRPRLRSLPALGQAIRVTAPQGVTGQRLPQSARPTTRPPHLPPVLSSPLQYSLPLNASRDGALSTAQGGMFLLRRILPRVGSRPEQGARPVTARPGDSVTYRLPEAGHTPRLSAGPRGDLHLLIRPPITVTW